jgi:uncharacterized damage-inducible protein DinB
MEFEYRKAVSILTRTLLVLRIFLQDLSTDWTHVNEGKNSWNAFDIMGHLIHSERTDWISRSEIILSDQPNKTFEPFSRQAHFTASNGKLLNDLFEEFESLREEDLKKLREMELTNERMALQGQHPEFGAVTLKQLLSAWVVHDLGHIAQISRVMAKQYKDEVGPWGKYLGILKK